MWSRAAICTNATSRDSTTPAGVVWDDVPLQIILKVNDTAPTFLSLAFISLAWLKRFLINEGTQQTPASFCQDQWWTTNGLNSLTFWLPRGFMTNTVQSEERTPPAASKQQQSRRLRHRILLRQPELLRQIWHEAFSWADNVNLYQKYFCSSIL